MFRQASRVIIGVLTLVVWVATAGSAADLRTVKTQKAKDVTVSVLSESGQWKPGKNEFVLVFTSSQDAKPVDVGKVTLSTSMPMPGMAPMLAGATVQPDATPGRYRGTISFPDSGDRQVTVRWDGPAGKGSTKFSVPVR
jgi:hypothetical protein